MHECSGQIRHRFRSWFWSSCLVVFPPMTPSHMNFSRRTLCTSNSLGCIVHMGILPSNDINHECCRQHQTSPSSGPERPPPQLSCFSSLPMLFFFSECCHRCVFFCTLLSAPYTLWNAVLVFVVITSACRIIGVILVSLFSFTLSSVASTTGRSSQWPALRSRHSVCVREIPHRYAS